MLAHKRRETSRFDLFEGITIPNRVYKWGKNIKAWKHLYFFQKELMKDLERLILSCYICETKAIVEDVETFERIAYLTVEASI